jgi:hypothetical protein
MTLVSPFGPLYNVTLVSPFESPYNVALVSSFESLYKMDVVTPWYIGLITITYSGSNAVTKSTIYSGT